MAHIRWLGNQLHRTWARALIGAAVLLAASFAALYFWLFADLPPVSAASERLIRPTTHILDRNGKLLYEVLDPNAGKQINLTLDDIPQACIQATLATEDSRFFLHPGVDPIAIARAMIQNWRGHAVVSGGSTLTQQLARTLLMTRQERYEQSLRRKLREAWLAWRMERVYTKDELLALYLNQIYYGNFAFGIEAAAQVFFAKPAAQLSRGECTLLAGLVQYPSGYNPLVDPQVAKARQETVLRLMREAGYIDQAEADAIAAEPLRYRSALFEIEAPHFVMYVQDLLARQVGTERLREGGLQIVTSLDLDLQRRAEAAIRYRLDLLNCRLPGLCDGQTSRDRRVDNAAAIILDNESGDILAMVGSPNYFDSTIQGNVNAALSLRQPGSAIKPLTYAAALDAEWAARAGVEPLTPASILPDLPVTFYVRDEGGGSVPYQPVNYDRRFHGPVSVRDALANSYNIPAVRVLERVGVETLQRLASEAGITTFSGKQGLALTLGGGEVRLLDLTTAFGVFKDGRRLESRAILSVSSAGDGEAVGAQVARTRSGAAQVIAPETAYLITDILSDNIARIPAFGSASVLELPFPAAVKTGTTTDWRDNWTIGYSTRRVVGVWVGNADNTPMLDVSGIDGAGPIWRDLMLAAHPTRPPAFARPTNIVDVPVCAPSGLLPTPECSRVRVERFVRGTEPQVADDQFRRIEVDVATGLRADESTPPERRVERVYWILPPEYTDWMIGQGIPLPPRAAPDAPQTMFAAQERASQPLVLTAPTSNTAYRLHPGIPGERQRLEIAGYVADGSPWAEVRLVVDDEVVARAADAARIATWWELEAGTHSIWMEGTQALGGETIRTAPSLVVVRDWNEQASVAANAGP